MPELPIANLHPRCGLPARFDLEESSFAIGLARFGAAPRRPRRSTWICKSSHPRLLLQQPIPVVPLPRFTTTGTIPLITLGPTRLTLPIKSDGRVSTETAWPSCTCFASDCGISNSAVLFEPITPRPRTLTGMSPRLTVSTQIASRRTIGAVRTLTPPVTRELVLEPYAWIAEACQLSNRLLDKFRGAIMFASSIS